MRATAPTLGLTCLAILCAVAAVACDRAEQRMPADTLSGVERERAAPAPEPPTSLASAFPRNEDGCDAEAAAKVDRWLRTWGQWHQGGETLPSAEDEAGGFIEREGPRLPPAHVLIHASRDGLLVENLKVGDWSWTDLNLSRSMHEEFADKEAFLERMKVEEAPIYAVAIERNVPAAHAARLLNLLEGVDRPVALAFRAPAIDPRFRIPASVREEHPQHFAKINPLQRLNAPVPPPPTCPEMIELGNVLTRVRSEMHWQLLERYLGERWVTCECELDIEWKLVLLTARYERHPLATTLPIQISRSAEPLVVKADATWAEVIPQVERATGPLYFAVEGGAHSPSSSPR